MVEIGRLLEINSRYPHRHAFQDCVGDQYLYARNRVFKRIRDYALACGISYMRSGSSLWHDYQVCPLFCLNVMLEEKSVPIVDNESSMKRLLERAGPSFAVTGKFLTKVLRRNYLLHESSHYIAHCLTSVAAPSKDADQACQSRYSIAAALVGEAFATVAERIAWSLGDNPAHILLFNLNSYVDHSVADHKLLIECIQEFGESAIARLGMIALFLNNLKKRPLTEKECDVILNDAFPQLHSEAVVRVRQLINGVFAIAPAFLEETTPAYFRLTGHENDFVAMSSRDYSIDELKALMLPPVTSELLDIIASAHSRVVVQEAS